jgi:two-component system response regulator YesN
MWKAVIIEDEEKIIQIMRNIQIWNELGIEVVGDALNGKEGMDLILRMRPDIVITDIYMPVMNGLAMIEQLRQHDYIGKIIVLSGYSDFEYARQALRLQVDDYLSKPISLDTMKQVLSRTIGEIESFNLERLKNEELKLKLKLYEPYIQKKWLNLVVTGTQDSDLGQIQEINKKFTDWNNKGHVVLVIEMMRTDRLAGFSLADQKLLYFALTNIIQEIASGAWPDSKVIELYSYHCALLLHLKEDEHETEVMQRVVKLAENTIESIFTYLKISISVGIGGVKQGWREIAQSTEEAFVSLYIKSRGLSTMGSIYALPESFKKEDYRDYYELKQGLYPFKLYQQLSEAISHGQFDQTIAIVQRFVIQLDGINKFPMTFIRHFYFELWTVVAQSLSQTGIDIKQLYPNLQSHEVIESFTTAKQMELWLIEKLQQISEQLQSNVNVKHLHAVEFIIQYVHVHYHEELTLSDIADQICISRSYLSHIFKKTTSETFNNYLTRVRIEKAKALIMEGKHLIYEIAEMVGYKNVPYFSTLFKKYTGMNPTQLFETYNSTNSSNIENNHTSSSYSL